MRRYGLIGKTLGHSYSQKFFQEKFAREGRFDCSYELYELPDILQFKDLVRETPDLMGVNVTIPYKQSIMSLLDAIDPEAEQVGAVNTVRIFREDDQIRTVGFNTDVEGFRQSLAGRHLPNQALVLGTGGASAAVTYVLQQWNVPYKLVSRNPQSEMLNYDQITAALLQAFPLVINCTPVGMFPHIDEKPCLPYEALTEHHYLYDLVYNPEMTAFLQEGQKRGAHVQNGLDMLHLQAEASWKIWNEAKRNVCL